MLEKTLESPLDCKDQQTAGPGPTGWGPGWASQVGRSALVASRLETEVTCDFCPFGDSYPWHQPQSKEIQATQVLQQPPTGLTGEEDAALAATWLQVQVRTQRRERAGGCGCCSSLGRQLCWGSSASGSSRFFALVKPSQVLCVPAQWLVAWSGADVCVTPFILPVAPPQNSQ